MMAIVECEGCNTEFERRNSEINRSKRLNRPQFCSLKCAGKNHLWKNIPKDKKIYERLIPDNRRDKFTNFRWYLKLILSRPHKECNISLLYLKQVWENQNGICPLTNEKLKLRTLTNSSEPLTPYHASVDRIDNSKGYVIGNIRYVAVMANFARYTFSDEELINFCRKVTEFNDD